MRPSAQQRGMAIISALLIAAVVAVIAAGMISRQSVFTRELESLQQRAQGQGVLQAGLAWSREVLAEQRRVDPLVRLDQGWARPIAGLPVGEHGAVFQGRLEDEQGKFNLRNLVVEEQPDEQALATFERLCALIGLAAPVAQAIAARVIDGYPRRQAPVAEAVHGFDSGRATSPGAASRPVPARRPMLRSLDQLAVPGLDAEGLARLRRVATVLPANTWINGNTASAEVLAAQVPGLSVDKARQLIAERDGGRWFVNRGDFVNRLQMPHVVLESVPVGITSDWFRLHGAARSGSREVRLEALLLRGQAPLAQVVWARVGA
ncbi:type II secretion system minor pseudopilin GspK [Pseudomonas sp. PS01300]|uniref:type II secretion system minor pseudopilin GspK n=1 Tax=Pseudomonas sp. PS01300 TaxID=2991436 RepID=UPI00249A2FB8|nr:type II secretion system minor pseudopilin GspK [Pseudomonas sp. PS01300]